MADTHTAFDIVEIARNRHTVKAYEPGHTLSEETMGKLKALLQLSPSSVNSQPWHFIFATTQEGKDRIADATAKYAFNQPSIRNASAVIVFASRLEADADYLNHILEVEEADGRFDADKETHKAAMDNGRNFFINIHKQDLKDVQHWMDKQVYLNMGHFMLGAEALGLDTTPMEGIDIPTLDEAFGLKEKGYSALALVCVGTRDPEADYNGNLPKSRLPLSEIVTEV